MSKKIYAPEEIIPGKKKDSTYVFLAGPIQGVHNWQDEDIPEIPEYDVTFIIPRRKEMDWTMVERWNKYVRPNSIVYHLGDFGNYEMLKYLNGKVILIRGNHNKEEKEKLLEYGFSDVINNTITFMYPKTDIEDDFNGAELILGHEPKTCLEVLKSKDKEYTYALFGHIHGRQKIKKFGIDVGVDANNFYPMRATKEVRFLINALQKGYYDDEVFVYSNHGA